MFFYIVIQRDYNTLIQFINLFNLKKAGIINPGLFAKKHIPSLIFCSSPLYKSSFQSNLQCKTEWRFLWIISRDLFDISFKIKNYIFSGRFWIFNLLCFSGGTTLFYHHPSGDVANAIYCNGFTFAGIPINSWSAFILGPGW